MRYLIAESIALKPHLETAGEIALQSLNEGHEVIYAWIGSDLPWSDWNLPKIATIFGCSLERRELNFSNLIANHGVKIFKNVKDEINWEKLVKEWAYSFNGDIEELKNYSYKNINLGAGVASSLISFVGNAAYDPREDINRARSCLATALLVYLRAERAIRSEKPDLIVTFNGRFATSRSIVEAARHLGVEVLRHERGSDFLHYELFSDAIHNFDYIAKRISDAWNKADLSKREGIGHQFFLRRRDGDGIGWYAFTDGQKKGLIPARTENKRRIVYFSSSDDEFASVADAYKAGPWRNQMAATNDLILASKSFPDLELIIRVHPHLMKKSAISRKIWSNLDSRDVKVIEANERVDSYALIDSADIVVSYGSTIGMEAAYWGKPSIVLGPCAYRNSHAVLTPSNRIQIENLISPDAQLQAPNKSDCLSYGHYFLTYGRKFRYYQPISLSEGRLLGRRLGWDPWIVYVLRRIGLGKIYKKFSKLINNI